MGICVTILVIHCKQKSSIVRIGNVRFYTKRECVINRKATHSYTCAVLQNKWKYTVVKQKVRTFSEDRHVFDAQQRENHTYVPSI